MKQLFWAIALPIVLYGCVHPAYSGPTLECKIAKPEYPAISRRRGESGIVYVRVTAGKDAQFESISIVKSSGYQRLDDSALQAMRWSKCAPAYSDGERIPFTFTEPF